MNFFRGGFFLSLLFTVFGCSSITRFLIVNKSDKPLKLVIDVPRLNSGAMIFSPFNFTLYPFKEGNLDYEARRSWSAKNPGNVHEVELPGYTVLEIGHLMNDKYQNSKQQFINGRVFNLQKIKTAGAEITQDNFDSFFKKTEYGIVWELP